MNTDFSQDFFQLFDLPRRFALDGTQLDARWRAASAEVHPDRYASAPDAERRLALMLATRVNEAYQTLKHPLPRGRYLLALAGVDTQEDTNTSMPVDFLMAQMEWREAIADARAQGNVDALEALSREFAADAAQLVDELAAQIDTHADLPAAALTLRKLRFLEKLEQEVGDAIEALLY